MPSKSLTIIDKGLDLKNPPNLINDGFTKDCKNVRLQNSEITKRFGYTIFSSQFPSGEWAVSFKQYQKFDGSSYLICCTNKHIHLRNTSTDIWDRITLQYITGTVTVTLNSSTVTGVGTTWISNAKIGDLFKISASAPEYIISVVNSDTQITLTTNYLQATQTGISYIITRLNSNNWGENWNFETYLDTLILTNGIDPVMKYTGTGNVQLLGGSPPKAKFVIEFENHLHLLSTVEGGYSCPQRDRHSNIGTIETWTGGTSGFTELVENPDWIMGVSKLGQNKIIYKDNSITTSSWLGSPILFRYNENEIVGIGLIASGSLQTYNGIDIFLGQDNVYMYDGAGIPNGVGNLIKDELFKKVLPQYINRSMSVIMKDTSEYWLLTCVNNEYPDYAWVLNLDTGSWYHFAFPGITTIGNYQKETGTIGIIDDLVGTIDEQNWRYDDANISKQSPIVILGNKDGYTYESNQFIFVDNPLIYNLTYDEGSVVTYATIKANYSAASTFKLSKDIYLTDIQVYFNNLGSADLIVSIVEGIPSNIINTLGQWIIPLTSLTSSSWNDIGDVYLTIKKDVIYSCILESNGTNHYEWGYKEGMPSNPYRCLYLKNPQVNWYIQNTYLPLMKLQCEGAEATPSYWTTQPIFANKENVNIQSSWMKLWYEGKGNSVIISYSLNNGLNWIVNNTQILTDKYEKYSSCMMVTSPSIIYKFENNNFNETFFIRNIKVDYIERGI